MANEAIVDIVDAIAAMLVERTYVALQAQFGVDDCAARHWGAITDGPIVGRRRDASLHFQVGNIFADNTRLATQGYPALLGSARSFHRNDGRRDVARAGRVDIIKVDPGVGLAWRTGRVADDEIITLGIAAICTQPTAAEMERRGTRTDRVVTRIDANAVVGSFPRERQVHAVINHAGDHPVELLAFLDGRVNAIPDDAAAFGCPAVVEFGHYCSRDAAI